MDILHQTLFIYIVFVSSIKFLVDQIHSLLNLFGHNCTELKKYAF